MTASTPYISIIIPAKNGGERIGHVLNAIFEQKTLLIFEVIVIDSGSSDQTLEILQRYPVRLHQISPEEFSHSGTRNYGAELAMASRYLVFLNQDAVPSDENWLDNLVRAQESHPDLKAVCAAELIEGAGYFDLTGVATYVFKTSRTKGLHIIEGHILDKLSDHTRQVQRELFPFTTVCAIFDKKHFLSHPFDPNVPWGEDLHWAVTNSRQGFSSGCTTLACVYHHHEYSDEERAAIHDHTRVLYATIFDWCIEDYGPGAIEAFLSRKDDEPAVHPAEMQLQEVLNSLSWKATAPLRWVHSHLFGIKGKEEGAGD